MDTKSFIYLTLLTTLITTAASQSVQLRPDLLELLKTDIVLPSSWPLGEVYCTCVIRCCQVTSEKRRAVTLALNMPMVRHKRCCGCQDCLLSEQLVLSALTVVS